MGTGFVEATRNIILNNLLGVSNDGTWPATVYVGLSTADPGIDGSGFSEPPGFAYARVAVTNDGAGWDAAAAAEKVNAALITFVAASGGAWGTIVAAGLFDAITAGNLLHWDDTDAAIPVNNGDDVRFQAGEFKIALDNLA